MSDEANEGGVECDPCHLITQSGCFDTLDFNTHQQILSDVFLGVSGVFPFSFHLPLAVKNVFLG